MKGMNGWSQAPMTHELIEASLRSSKRPNGDGSGQEPPVMPQVSMWVIWRCLVGIERWRCVQGDAMYMKRSLELTQEFSNRRLR